MTASPPASRIIVGVGAVIWNAREEVLLIRRGHPPRQGAWSLPGGKVEFGEPLTQAIRREVREETGLEIEILGLIDVAELLPGGAEDFQGHYVLVDFAARALTAAAVAGSDAMDVRWASLAGLAEFQLWAETQRIILLGAETYRSHITA